MFHNIQSKNSSVHVNEFLCTVCVWWRKLQNIILEVERSEIWRWQFIIRLLSKKEKRKDRYNCMCVCVLSLQDKSNSGRVWGMKAVCAQPASKAQLLRIEYFARRYTYNPTCLMVH